MREQKYNYFRLNKCTNVAVLNCRQICLYHKIDNIITGVTNFIDVIIEREGRLRRFFRFVTGIL